ncbi:MAG: 3'-5' exonuclease, partial [Weeksellaceae bacterium]|nr:3'-5' exonuclease [Weeksellaceae bacterium]
LLNPYTWIQVDEVQDLNPLQWEIFNLLSANQCHHVLFGDYGQAIFSFMGARTESLKVVEKTYRVYKLRQNYRSPSDLVDIYNAFSEKYMENDSFKILPFRSESKGQNSFFLSVVGSRKDEAECVIKKILPSISENKDETVAILLRSNNTADLYSWVLNKNGKEHFKVSGFDLFSRAVVKDSLAFLNVLANENDRKAWSRVFKIFSKTNTLKESRELIRQIFELGMSPTDFLKSSDHTLLPFGPFNDVFENGRVVVFDTETTGLDSSNDIIQIGAVEIVKGQIGREFEVFLKTDQSLVETTKIHNITPEILDKHGVDRKKGLIDFWSFVNGSPLFAHNIQYDWKMLFANSIRSKVDILEKPVLFDSLEFCRRLFPDLWSHKLEKMILYLNIPGVNSHNALDDVHATANLIISIFPILKNKCSEQRLWFERNENRILEFKKNLSSIWRIWLSMLECEITFPKVIKSFLSYVNGLKKKETNAELKEMDKLFRHMEKQCGTRRFRELLSLDFCLPWYQFCKESDLILGDEKLVISTIHKAKGREFDNVIIPECVDGIYPHFFSKTDEEKKEDARVFYVAITRAKKRLILTSHTYDEIKREYREDSPYIKMIKPLLKHFKYY